MIKEINCIADLLVSNKSQIGDFKAYLFGSILTNKPYPNDIDILIIYQNDEQPKIIRSILENFGFPPVHLLFLTEEEAKIKEFIIKHRCKKIPI